MPPRCKKRGNYFKGGGGGKKQAATKPKKGRRRVYSSVVDPDPHQSDKLYPDPEPHQSDKLYPDPEPHQSDNQQRWLFTLNSSFDTSRFTYLKMCAKNT